MNSPHRESLRTPLPGKRINASAQVAMKRDLRRMFADMTRQLTVILTLRSGADGQISQSEEEVIRSESRDIVQGYFVGVLSVSANGTVARSPFASNGVTALAAFPRILNKYYARVTGQNVRAHQVWMQKNLPAELAGYLSRAQLPDDIQRESIAPSIIRAALRKFEPMHTWKDVRGYKLSDRIWRLTAETERMIDDVMMEGIRTGMGHVKLAKRLEQFLDPERVAIKGRGDASYNAKRLARTEISRASNQSALLAGRMNPYVDRVDIVRSRNGDPKCPTCPQHATIDINQNRVKEPIPIDDVDPPPYHSNDMCHIRPVAVDNPDAVTQQLLQSRNQGDPAPLTPISADRMLRWMLGAYLFNQWLNEENAA